MGKPRIGIVAAWIGFTGVVLAALITVFAGARHQQSMKVEDSPGSKNTQVTGNYTSQEMNNSPGATQVAGDQKIYYSIPQTETRPYLSVELRPGPNEYMRKDGNSQLFLICCYENSFLVLPFKIKNAGKTHATHIEAEYSSPDQQNVTIALGEKSNFLASGDEILETFRPHINISRIAQNEDGKEFNLELLITYQKYDESNSTTYNSRFELVLAKVEINGFPKAYKILKSNLIFEENEKKTGAK